MKARGKRLSAFFAAVPAAVLAVGAARAANGPWLVVADSADGSATSVNLSTGAVQRQSGLGSELVGAAATSGTVAFTDFLGGKVRELQANPQGQFLGITKGTIVTSPDDANPEGITLLGEGGRALITDGGTLPGGSQIALILVDLAAGTKLASLPLPSVYAAAYDPSIRIAHVVDGLSMQVIDVAVGAGGTLQDTGMRTPLNGTPQGTRFIASYAGGTRLLVSHKTDGAVEVLDAVNHVSLGRVEGVGTAIGAIAVTPDGTKALVADFAGSQWAVLDLTAYSGFPTDTGIRIPVAGGVPNTFVGTRTFAFLGNKMYFSQLSTNGIAAIDWMSLTVLPDYYPTGSGPAGLDIAF